MRHNPAAGMLAILGLLVWAAPAFAHHSFSAEFDGTKKITLEGTLTKVDWVNPHIVLHVDVKDSSGKITNWAVETGPTVALHRYGARRNMFVEGQTITIEAYPCKDGTKALAGLRHVKFQDGTEFNYFDPDTQQDGKQQALERDLEELERACLPARNARGGMRA
jgi:hypothetical protein